MLSQSSLEKLISIGVKYKCELHFPPFFNRLSSFYSVDELSGRKTILLKKDLNDNGFLYNAHIINGKKFIEIIEG